MVCIVQKTAGNIQNITKPSTDKYAILFKMDFIVFLYRDIVYNTEQHIRVFESLLKGGDWGEKLPDFMAAPGKDLAGIFNVLWFVHTNWEQVFYPLYWHR